jgi:hypothetical protein
VLKSVFVISGNVHWRRRRLLWFLLVSAAIHAAVLGVLFNMLAHAIIPRGTPEQISQITVSSVQRPQRQQPRPQRTPQPVRAQQPVERRSAPRPFHSRIRPPRLHERETDNLARDRATFAKEVAQLDKADDPHAIPTTDPATQESLTKSYAFHVPASLRGDEHGNGIITPTQSWHDAGRDCYYGRYEYTYPDGAEESGNIAWPFCYQPDDDPFKLPPHPMPFPPPLPGYVLPAGTALPPLEKDFYDRWIASQ